MRPSFVFPLLVASTALVVQGHADAEAPDGAGDKTLIDTLTHRVSRLRGLPVRRPIVRGKMTRSQLRERLLERLARDFTEAEILAEELALKRLQLLPLNANYKELVISTLTDQIAGFYDPIDKQLYLPEGSIEPDALEIEHSLLAHEIDHALQDQNFDLKAFLDLNRELGDELLARRALVEGDSMAVMLEVQAAPLLPWNRPTSGMRQQLESGMSSSAFQRAPLILREQLIFPYASGVEFIAHFRRRHPWSAIDRIYRNPPRSTEQILHPRKYESHEHPVIVRARRQLGTSVRFYSNVLGELGLRVLLQTHGLPLARAEIGASGWGGDSIAMFSASSDRRLDATIGVLYTVWDHEADATEFFHVASEIAPRLTSWRHTTRLPRVPDDRLLLLLDPELDRATTVEQRGNRVVVVVAAPASEQHALRKQIWKGWKVLPAGYTATPR